MQPSLADARYAALHEGDQPISGFRLVRRRGRGGFGEVWEAEASGGILVALKFVRLSSRARAAELRALEFVRGIHHPNLLANFGSWQVDDTLIIGMELADRSLWDRYAEATHQGLRGIPRRELLGYLAEVAGGLDHLNGYRHTLDGRAGFGIQHRDLKPSNILLFGGGAKVADLGMARAMDSDVAGHTGIWTFAYAAPEFFRGETTRQSDQYGLAASYCQLRGGQLPFDGSAASMTAGHLFGRPDLGSLPEPERPIVERALAKVPGERWPDCRTFVEALRALPPDSVPDVLVDPEGPSDIPREFRSSTGAISGLPTGLGGSDGGGPASGWQPAVPTVYHPESDSSFASRPGFPDSFPSSDEESPLPTDFVPTLILSPPPTRLETTPEDPPRPPRRWAWIGIGAAAAAVAAIALATSGAHAPTLSGHAPDAAGPRPPAPTLVLADGIGSAAEAGVDPDNPTTPASMPLPVGSREVSAPARPEEEPASTAPAPKRPETAGGESRPAPMSPAEPGPAPVPNAQPDLVLEGPREMEAAGFQPPPRLPEGQAAEPSTPKDPEVAAPEDGRATPPPTGKGESGQAASPPLPERSPPAQAPRTVASHNASATIVHHGDPTPAGARSTLAEAAFRRGQDSFQQATATQSQEMFLQAFVEFNEAIRLDPGHIASYLPRAIARHRAGNPRAALVDYDDAIRVKPADIDAYVSRGAAFHDLGEYRRAIADYDEVIRRLPRDPEARFRRGLSRLRLGEVAESIGDFDDALSLEPRHGYAIEYRAEAIAHLDSNKSRASDPATVQALPSSATAPVSPPDSKVMAQGTVSPATGGPVHMPASPPGAVGDRAVVRETSHFMAPPPAGRDGRVAAPGGQPRNPGAARPGSKPKVQERRKAPGLGFPFWPFGKKR